MDQYNFKVLVLFYSFAGHTAKLAEYIAQGAREIEGAEVEVKQVPELAPQEIAAFFTSSGSMHGGEEAALLSLMIPLLNLGMVPIGVPYPIQGEGQDFDAGSPYGAVYVSGHKGDKEVGEGDIKVAKILGKRLAAMAKIMKYGCENFPDCQFLSTQYD